MLLGCHGNTHSMLDKGPGSGSMHHRNGPRMYGVQRCRRSQPWLRTGFAFVNHCHAALMRLEFGSRRYEASLCRIPALDATQHLFQTRAATGTFDRVPLRVSQMGIL